MRLFFLTINENNHVQTFFHLNLLMLAYLQILVNYQLRSHFISFPYRAAYLSFSQETGELLGGSLFFPSPASHKRTLDREGAHFIQDLKFSVSVLVSKRFILRCQKQQRCVLTLYLLCYEFKLTIVSFGFLCFADNTSTTKRTHPGRRKGRR
jgi:hypothetical protein